MASMKETASVACRSAPASGLPASAGNTGWSTSAKSSVNVAACGPCAAIVKSNPANSNDCVVPPAGGAVAAAVVFLPPRGIDERFVRLGDAMEQRFRRHGPPD